MMNHALNTRIILEKPPSHKLMGLKADLDNSPKIVYSGAASRGRYQCFYHFQLDLHHPGYQDTSKPAVENWLGEPKRPQWTGYLDYMEGHL
jgi:hypothetical protein